MKTVRNCLHHSEFGDSFSRLMWNNDNYLNWQHVKNIVNMNRGLKTAPKMREEHINLSSHSVMKVNLAVQPRATNANILRHGTEKHGTAEFCSIMNTFFDIMNVRNSKEHILKKNLFLKPFQSEDDERFEWLINTIIKYFDEWKEKTLERPGFMLKEKGKMFISKQTMEGLKITAFSMIECTRFLLRSGMPYVLTEKLHRITWSCILVYSVLVVTGLTTQLCTNLAITIMVLE